MNDADVVFWRACSTCGQPFQPTPCQIRKYNWLCNPCRRARYVLRPSLVFEGQPPRAKSTPLTRRHRLRKLIFDALFNRAGQFVPTETLIEIVWGHREDGGPDRPSNCVNRTIVRLRKRGHVIKAVRVGKTSKGYMLVI